MDLPDKGSVVKGEWDEGGGGGLGRSGKPHGQTDRQAITERDENEIRQISKCHTNHWRDKTPHDQFSRQLAVSGGYSYTPAHTRHPVAANGKSRTMRDRQKFDKLATTHVRYGTARVVYVCTMASRFEF